MPSAAYFLPKLLTITPEKTQTLTFLLSIEFLELDYSLNNYSDLNSGNYLAKQSHISYGANM